MSLIPIVALAALTFLAAAFVLKLPRSGWTLFGAAMLFGLTGYAWQGAPDQPAAPLSAAEEVSESGEVIVRARRDFFQPDTLPARYVVNGDAFARQGQWQDAAAFYGNALQDNPENVEAWVALGNALVEHADAQLSKAALYAYSQAETIAPDNMAARYFYGLTLLRNGQPGQARAIWADILDKSPEDARWREPLTIQLERLDGLLSQSGMGPGAN